MTEILFIVEESPEGGYTAHAVDASIKSGAEYVSGARERLEQAIQNLAANAIRYAPSGSTLQASNPDHRCRPRR